MATHGTPISSLSNNKLAGNEEELVNQIMADYNSQETGGAPVGTPVGPPSDGSVPMYDPNPPPPPPLEEEYVEEYDNYVDEDGNYAVEKTLAYEKKPTTLDHLKITIVVVVLFVILNLPILTSIVDPVLARFHVPHLSLILRTVIIGVVVYLVNAYLL